MNAAKPQGGAYARRGLLTPQGAARERREPVYTGPGWQLYVDTTEGQIVLRGGLNERHVRTVAERYQALTERDLPVRDGQVRMVGLVVLDPDDQPRHTWGQRVTPGVSRWRALKRFTGIHTANGVHWTRCADCRTVLWPGRLVAVTRTMPVTGEENDEACTGCLRGREKADPRPSWPYEPPEPAREHWPEYLIKDKAVPLPKGLKKPPKLNNIKKSRRK